MTNPITRCNPEEFEHTNALLIDAGLPVLTRERELDVLKALGGLGGLRATLDALPRHPDYAACLIGLLLGDDETPIVRESYRRRMQPRVRQKDKLAPASLVASSASSPGWAPNPAADPSRNPASDPLRNPAVPRPAPPPEIRTLTDDPLDPDSTPDDSELPLDQYTVYGKGQAIQFLGCYVPSGRGRTIQLRAAQAIDPAEPKGPLDWSNPIIATLQGFELGLLLGVLLGVSPGMDCVARGSQDEVLVLAHDHTSSTGGGIEVLVGEGARLVRVSITHREILSVIAVCERCTGPRLGLPWTDALHKLRRQAALFHSAQQA